MKYHIRRDSMSTLLWKYISRLDIARKHKHRIFLLINAGLYGLLGYLVWLLIGENFFVNREEWLLTFVGYPAVLGGFLLGIFLLFKMDQ